MEEFNGKIYMYFNKTKYEQEGVKKYYIGQTTQSISRRAGREGANYLLSKNTKFAKAIMKWGWKSFEVTILKDNIPNIEELNELEVYYINLYDSFNNGYNSTLGGDGKYGCKWTEEMKQQKRESMMGENNHMFGVKMSDESREKMSKAKIGLPSHRKGTKHTDESIVKIRESVSGENNHNFGKHFTEEHRRKISESQPSRRVYCKELDMVFERIVDAKKYICKLCNMTINGANNISSVCNGKRKYCGKYEKDGEIIYLTWIYLD